MVLLKQVETSNYVMVLHLQAILDYMYTCTKTQCTFLHASSSSSNFSVYFSFLTSNKVYMEFICQEGDQVR